MIGWFLVVLLLAAPAHADSGMLLGGVANRQMPLDRLTAPTNCYSGRRLRTAYTANKAKNIVRASDSATTDIGFTSAGYPDIAAENTFLAATTGKRVTWYDQCGSRDLVQATDSNRPAEVPTCLGNLGCLRITNSATIGVASSSNFTPATGLVSISTVARRLSGTSACTLARVNGTNNRMTMTNGATTYTLTGGTSGSFTAAASENAWIAGIGIINGASSRIGINGTETTGTATGNTTAGTTQVLGGTTTSCDQAELIIWDNYALSAAERPFLVSGQRIAWSF